MIRNGNDHFHLPVLAVEVARLLLRNRDGVYLDLTAGGGGHMAALCERLSETGRIYGLDRDRSAVETAKARLSGIAQVREIVHGRFGDIRGIVGAWTDKQFDGILLDIGVSSAQIDRAGRGFSYRADGPLDMRMDPEQGESAAELLATVSATELKKILFTFGQERHSARIADRIVMERLKKQIKTTGQLAEIICSVIHPPHQNKSLARVFQALRIYINKELEQLGAVLPQALELLHPSGRMAVISYHSLEDGMVKRFFKECSRPKCSCPPGLAVCACGAVTTMRTITRGAIKATEAEIRANPRARSARLRVGEKL